MHRVPLLLVAVVGLVACASSRARGGAGTYELVRPCDSSLCGEARTQRQTLVLLDSPARAQSEQSEIYECTQERGFPFTGCIVERDAGGGPRIVAWNRGGGQIRVAIACGPDGGDPLLFVVGSSQAIWQGGLANSDSLTDTPAGVPFDITRAGDPDRSRCT